MDLLGLLPRSELRPPGPCPDSDRTLWKSWIRCGIGYLMTAICLNSPLDTWCWHVPRSTWCSFVHTHHIGAPYENSARFLTSAALISTTFLEHRCLNMRVSEAQNYCPVQVLS